MKNVRELKSQLRAKHKKIRKSCPPEKKQQLDLALQNAFLASEEYKNCDVLFAFVSSPIEVDTSLILETTLKDGKRLALPKCKNNFGEMDFYLVNSLSQLERVRFQSWNQTPRFAKSTRISHTDSVLFRDFALICRGSALDSARVTTTDFYRIFREQALGFATPNV